MLIIPIWQKTLVIAICLGGVLLAFPNLFYDRVERYNDAVVRMENRGAADPETQAGLDLWPSWLPSSLVSLGLDLRGGAHLLAEIQLEDVHADRMDALWPEVRDVLRQNRDLVGSIRRQAAPPDELRVSIANTDALDEAAGLIGEISRPILTLGGLNSSTLDVAVEDNMIHIALTDDERAATDNRTMQQSLEIIRRRVDEVGTREPIIQRQGTDRIIIQVPGIGSAAELKELLGQTARLSFHHVIRTVNSGTAQPSGRQVVYPDIDNPDLSYVLERVPVVAGEDLTDAQPDFDENGLPAVSFRFNPTGARRFGDYTAENIGLPFAIALDGEVISAPVIRSHIPGGSGIITGQFTVEESTNLAVLLRAGALPAGMVFLEERTVGPELGQDSIDAGKVACIVAAGAVLVFMILSYGLFGLFANAALMVNLFLIFGILSILGATLTLPGIAGIVLTIGMAVDANVLVFERIREELKTAKGPSRAIEVGYERALTAILDANITTLIAATILFMLGTGPVKGFSVTLGIGVITSMFTAIFLTRLLVVVWYSRRRPRTLNI
ncbi:MAG: protein translocase subunit SecD [Rhodobacteraceae bacterium]|nr:protein translocase subunit SecD [Paracoccaceae bacterium]